MKRLSIMFLAILLLLAFVSCNGTAEDDISKIDITLPPPEDTSIVLTDNEPKEVRLKGPEEGAKLSLSDSLDVEVEIVNGTLLEEDSDVLLEIICPGFSIRDEDGNVYEGGLKKELVIKGKMEDWYEQTGYKGGFVTEFKLRFTLTPSSLDDGPEVYGKIRFQIEYADFVSHGKWQEGLSHADLIYYASNGESIGYSLICTPINIIENPTTNGWIEYTEDSIPDWAQWDPDKDEIPPNIGE